MRGTVLAAILIVTGAGPASAELWRSREGDCGQWRSRWNVQQDQSGAWTGRLERLHIGGRCETRTDETAQAEVRAALVGDNFFATRFPGTDGQACNYFGVLQGDRVRGLAFCGGNPRALRFVMRFPGNDPRARNAPPLQQDEAYSEQDAEPQADENVENFYRRLPGQR